jgi:murein DD-endopeptidase MepM/ murein hydrolase activator NlpD
MSTAGSSGRSGSVPVPLIPRFAWSPKYADFPLPFPGSEAVGRPVDVRSSPATALPGAGQQIPWQKVLPVAALALAILAFGYFALADRGGDDDDGQQGTGNNATLTATSQSGSPTQRPGEGGAAATTTSGAAATGTENAGVGSGDETESPEGTEAVGGDDEPVATGGTGATEPSGDDGIVDPAELGIIQVEAEEGETLIDIANEWGLEVSTLVWANGIEDPGMPLPAGTLVTVPPFDGVIHEVAEGETLESIAALYGVAPIDIINITQNNVQSDADLHPGLLITVPYSTPQTRGGLAVYTVKEGDDLWKIAGYYGIDPLTIAYANEIPASFMIFPGQTLIIPPADGILYWTVEGDTVESIAAAFSVDPALIRDFPFNNVPGTSQPTPEQPILIPGLTPVIDASKGGGGGAPASDPFAGAPSAPESEGIATGTWIWPTTGDITTTYGGHHNGLDIANAPWTPILAADGGVISFAGWNEHGLGYAVAIDHENGYVTWYGHLAEAPSVVTGQRVSQGDWIGPMGSTGKSTGPHLHFIVTFQDAYYDPLTILP